MADFIINDDGTIDIFDKKKKKESDKWDIRNATLAGQSKNNSWQQGVGEKEWYEQILQKPQAFEDGYQFGDVTKTVFGTAGDILSTGAKATWQNIYDIGMNVAGANYWALDKIGILPGAYDAFTDIERYKQDVAVVSDINKGVDKLNQATRNNSVLGDFSKNTLQSAVQSAEMAGLSKFSKLPLWQANSLATGFRNEYVNALNNGATKEQATISGLTSGISEVLTEYLFSGFIKLPGTGSGLDTALGKATEKIGNQFLRTAAQYGINIGGEAFEEVLSGFGSALGQKLTYLKDTDFKDIYSLEDALENAGAGALSALFGSANPQTIQNIRDGRNLVTGLTSTQQKYIDEIAQQRMVEAQKRNEKLSLIQKGKINQRTMTDFEKGRLADVSKLQQVNLPGLSNKDMDLQQSAYKYGINPNSEFVVTTKTMLDNRGIKSRFDADAFKGSNENSYWTKKTDGTREVVFNPNASEQTILEEIAIHELTHDLMSSENSKDVIENQKIMNYVSTLDGYEKARTKVEELYAEQTKKLKTEEEKIAYIDEEIVADTLGKNIGSQEYIRRLIDDEPSIAKNIYDWVVNKVANKNGVKNEKAYWNNVKNNFEKAYNMEYQGKGSKNDAKFAIANTEFANLTPNQQKRFDNAEKLRKEGKSSDEIWYKTGFEYKDSNNSYDFHVEDLKFKKTLNVKTGQAYNIEEVLEGELLDTYPFLRNKEIVMEDLIKDAQKDGVTNTKYLKQLKGVQGATTTDGKLVLNTRNLKSTQEATNVLSHEIQHLIQDYQENGSEETTYFGIDENGNYYTKGATEKDALAAYRNHKNEIEAEVTRVQNAMTKEQRHKYPLSLLINEVSKHYSVTNSSIKPDKFISNLEKKYGQLLDEWYDNGGSDANAQNKNERNTNTNSANITQNESESHKRNNIANLPGTRRGSKNFTNLYVEHSESNVGANDSESNRNTRTQELDNSSFFNEETRYSLSDNKGRELTKKQQEWSKDSKVRDENGNLLTLYHGTPNDNFTIFENKSVGTGAGLMGLKQKGFYFTDRYESAESYSAVKGINENNGVKEVYLNMTNPLVVDTTTESGKQAIRDMFGLRKNAKVTYNFINKYINKMLYDDAINIRSEEQRQEFFNSTGYDGVILKTDLGTDNEYIVFESNQIKSVDNLNPTDDADIRYSLSTEDLKQKQLDIILKSNPAEDDYHTWIRSVDDIKTYEEALQEELDGETQGLTPDFKKADLEKALETGKMTVYSSYPIEQGIFVTPSKMEAQSYAGSEKVYSKEISLDDVAWIDTLQGQYAKVQPSDIRNSQQTEGWQSFLDKNFEAKGTKTRLSDIKLPGITNTVQEEVQTEVQKSLLPIANELKELNKNLNKVLNPNEISQLTPQDANTTPNLPGINRNQVGDGRSSFFDNINNKVNMLNDEQKAAILSSNDVKYYDKVTNKDSLDKAYARLQENGQSESLRWFNKASESADATDVAEGWILLKHYADSGDTNGMVEVAKKLRDMGTKAGQTVQAFNIMSRLTPEGMVKYAQSELLEAYDQMVKNKSAKWIEENRSKFDLQPNEVQFIMDTMREVSTMEDGYDKRFKLAQIQKLMTDKLPPSKGAGIKAWMRISMLFNPKTQVRNVAGNALIAPINAFGDMFASGVDKLISAKTGVRTTGNTNWKNYAQGMKTGLYQSYNDFKNGVNTRNIEGNRFEVTEGKSFNDNNPIGKALNKVDSLLSFMLDAGDRGFYEASFVNSINNQMVLNNTTEVTQEMIDIATQEALSRTWQDNNEYTKFVMNIRNGLNKMTIGGYGLGDILIPFAKTPANLTKAIVEYSPAGLIGTINKGIKLNRSLTNGQYSAKTQHEFVQSLGKATAGTMLYILGIALANAGVTTGESDEDKDVSNFMKNTLGVNSYSIKIGDMSFTYDWAQPLAAPLAITANLVQKQKEEASLLENVVSTLDTAGNLLLEQSFMESISTVLNNNEGVATGMQEAILDLPARAIPTFLKQITDLTDGTQRQTFVKDKPLESMWNSVKAKIPGLSYTLDPSVDTLGREIQKYGGKNNLFNVFLNPANVSTENVSESAQEIYRLYKETGETNIMPRVAPYYVNKKGEKIILSTEERTEYQKISGAIIEENIANLLSSTAYQNMTDTNKAEVINDIVNYSYNIAQNQVLGLELADTYKTAYEYAQIGDISDFYEFRNSIDDTDSTTKRTSIKNYLINSDLDDNQIANLYGNYYSSDKTLNAMLGLRIPMKEFIKFDSEDIQGQYNTNTGQTISGSKKNATIEYVNTLNLSKAQRAILVKSAYSSYKNNDNDIIRYVNTLPGTANEKKVLLKSIGFDAYDDDVFNYINSQNLSKDEKIKKLKELGFTVRDGRVYY